jgi:hypothetical protein
MAGTGKIFIELVLLLKFCKESLHRISRKFYKRLVADKTSQPNGRGLCMKCFLPRKEDPTRNVLQANQFQLAKIIVYYIMLCSG